MQTTWCASLDASAEVLRLAAERQAANPLADYSEPLPDRLALFQAMPVHAQNQAIYRLVDEFNHSRVFCVAETLLTLLHHASGIDSMEMLTLLIKIAAMHWKLNMTDATGDTHLDHTLVAKYVWEEFDRIVFMDPEFTKTVSWTLFGDAILEFLVYDAEKYRHRLYEFLSRADVSVHLRYQFITKTRTRVSQKFHHETLEWMLPQLEPRLQILTLKQLLAECGSRAQYTKWTNALLAFVRMEVTDENVRTIADAADSLLLLHEKAFEIECMDKLTQLGTRGAAVLSTFYDNAENIHRVDFDKIKNGIQYLETAVVQNQQTLTELETIFESLDAMVARMYPDKPDRVLRAFERAKFRIANETSNISRTINCSLARLLQNMWAYIQTLPFKDALERRFVEEMLDSAGLDESSDTDTCTSGYYIRLLNIPTGFIERAFVGMSCADEIRAKVYLLFQQAIMDSECSDTILNELTETSMRDRPELRNLYRAVIPQILEQVRAEYKNLLEDADIDSYLTAAVQKFETS